MSLASFFGYDNEVLNEYIKNYKPVDELQFLLKYPDKRIVIHLTDDDLSKIDLGYKLLCTKKPDLKITYKEFKKNSIIIGNQKYKLFKYINDEKLSEEVGKYKLPNTDLFIVLSINFDDFISASSTSNNWTSCINLNNGDYKYTVLSHIFSKGRFIIYITDCTKKTFNEPDFSCLNPYVMYQRSFGFVDTNGNLKSILWYPSRIQIDVNVSDKDTSIDVSSIEKRSYSKYNIDIIKNKYDSFILPYIDNCNIICKEKEIYYSCTRKGTSFSPKVLIDNKFINFDNYFKFENLPFYERLKKHCDICGTKNGIIDTINNVNYCSKCMPNHKETCSICGKEKSCTLTTDNTYICNDCIISKGYKLCEKCGTAYKINRYHNCKFCRSKYFDIYKNSDFSFFDKKKNNYYDYYKHLLYKDDAEPKELNWNDETGEFEK